VKGNKRTKMLYRKVNTRTRFVHHFIGPDYRHERHSKNINGDELPLRSSMHGKKQRGLDYTPLYHFLLSKVGLRWDDIFSEAVKRLDRPDPIYHLVARSIDQRRDYVNVDESTCFSGLYVDDNGLLQKVNPTLCTDDIPVTCRCCTHTFNGEVIRREENENLS
jgi:hypothetical protein